MEHPKLVSLVNRGRAQSPCTRISIAVMSHNDHSEGRCNHTSRLLLAAVSLLILLQPPQVECWTLRLDLGSEGSNQIVPSTKPAPPQRVCLDTIGALCEAKGTSETAKKSAESHNASVKSPASSKATGDDGKRLYLLQLPNESGWIQFNNPTKRGKTGMLIGREINDIYFISLNSSHTAATLEIVDLEANPKRKTNFVSIGFLDYAKGALNESYSLEAKCPNGGTEQKLAVPTSERIAKIFNAPARDPDSGRPIWPSDCTRRGIKYLRDRFCQGLLNCKLDYSRVEVKLKGRGLHFEWSNLIKADGLSRRRIIIPNRALRIRLTGSGSNRPSQFKIRYEFLTADEMPSAANGKYYCRNSNVISLSKRCDGYDDCGDASDESMTICGYSIYSRTSIDEDNRVPLEYYNINDMQCPGVWHNSLVGLTDTNASAGGRVRRVIGGKVAKRGAWPALVSLQEDDHESAKHFCAGTLVHPEYVLTAAHCAQLYKDGIKAIFGAHDLTPDAESGHTQLRYVDDVLLYPGIGVDRLNRLHGADWIVDVLGDDIALLHLNAPVLITPHVTPACLPPLNAPVPDNSTCQIIGWGTTDGPSESFQIQQVPMTILENCYQLAANHGSPVPSSRSVPSTPLAWLQDLSDKPFHIPYIDVDSFEQNIVCGKSIRGQGACLGDSGGPLYCERVADGKSRWQEVHGIVSYGLVTDNQSCTPGNAPDYFTRVSRKVLWLESTMMMLEKIYLKRYPDSTQ